MTILDRAESLQAQGERSAAAPDRKQRALRALSELPPFSPILNRLMASLADESVALASLADLIEKDPVLAGNILSLVNSARYARRGTVNSVRHAIALLGVGKIRNAALGMSIAGMWSRMNFPHGWSMKAFNLHSAATALLADMIALVAPVEYPEGAFAAGLLHDLGRLLIANALPDEFVQVLQRHAQTGAPIHECEQAVLGFTHAELSELALDVWQLPPAIVKAAGSHHQPAQPVSGIAEIPLGQVVAAADCYINSLGISIAESKPASEPNIDALLALGLARPRAEKLLTSFETEFAALAPPFQ